MRVFSKFGHLHSSSAARDSASQTALKQPQGGSASQYGFTLVELAVVLMIVGLLVAGVIKGRELLQNSRVNSVIMQVNGFNFAIDGFKKIYGSLPGDMIDGGTRLPLCTAAPCNVAGNGDGRIGVNNTTNTVDQAATSENRVFWRQLAAAGLVGGISTDYAGTPNVFGIDYPTSPIGGGWQIVYRDYGTATPMPGHWFTSQSQTSNHGARVGTFSATNAMRVERKIDDGVWNTGSVVGFTQALRDCGIGGAGNYDERNPAATPCDLDFSAKVQ